MIYTIVTLKSKDKHKLELQYKGDLKSEDIKNKVNISLNKLDYIHNEYMIIKIDKRNDNVRS